MCHTFHNNYTNSCDYRVTRAGNGCRVINRGWYAPVYDGDVGFVSPRRNQILQENTSFVQPAGHNNNNFYKYLILILGIR